MIKNLILLLVLPYSLSQSNTTEIDTCNSEGPWNSLLLDWATSPNTTRQGRILSLPQTNGYYVTDRIDRPSLPPPRRPYDEWPVMTPPPPPVPGKIVNRPPNPYKDKVKPGYNPNKPVMQQMQQRPPPPRPGGVDRVDEPQRKEVSETDLFLLGAIEKLVYRVDLMEKRLRKMEESLHYLVAGTDKLPDPCVTNFSRVGSTCYHFSREEYDWKSANLACRKFGSALLEATDEDQKRRLLAAVQADNTLRGADLWTGGLNPGLLWIWSNSGRPVIKNTTSTESPTITIHGEGRCLALSYDPAIRSYIYRGQDCAIRHRYICQKAEDKAKLSNEIERIAKKMRFEGKSRKAKILWNDSLE